MRIMATGAAFISIGRMRLDLGEILGLMAVGAKTRYRLGQELALLRLMRGVTGPTVTVSSGVVFKSGLYECLLEIFVAIEAQLRDWF